MPVATSIQFLRQILVPLAWMHTLDPPLVHGDLKPDNVLLAQDSALVLTDFGLASRLPLAGLGGAVTYQSPETLLGGGAELAADIYGVGLMWYEMLTGRQPFSEVGLQAVADDDTAAFVRAHQESRKWPMRPPDPSRHEADDPRVPLPSELNEELRRHPKLEEMLKRCLAYRQSERYANARLLLDQINGYLRGDPSLDVPVISHTEAVDVLLPKETAESLLENARVFLERGDAAKARSLAEELLRQDARSVPALLLLARAQAASGQIDEAKETLTKAQQLDRESPDVFEAMADLFQAMNKPEMAKSLREQARKFRERNAQARRR
jgi:serine/threonine protein kinase